VFAGYGSCTNQPDAWHQYGPGSRYDSQLPWSVSVSPGYWKVSESPLLARDPAAFETAVQQMVAAGADWQLVITWSEWGEGTAVEPALEFGNTYIDILCRNLPGSTPCEDAPTPTPTATPTATPTPTPGAPNQVLTFVPTHDAYIRGDKPDANFGATTLQVDNSPQKNFLMKFTVSGVNGRQVGSAKLRLYSVDPSDLGGNFHRVVDNNWSEGTVTWNNAPAADSERVAWLGGVTNGNWYEADVTSLITGDGTFSLRVDSASANGADYSSKEGAAAFVPQLVLTVASTEPAPEFLPDLTVTKSDDVDPVLVGWDVTYTITSYNLGEGPAAGVVVRDVLDGGSIKAVTSSQGTCFLAALVEVTCDLGTLNPGEVATITVTVTAPCALMTITETAVIDPNLNIGESDETNNSTTETTVVTGAQGTPTPTPAPAPTPTPAPGSDPVLVGAGDIASCKSDGDEATAKLLDAIPGTVFTTGDNAYYSGTDEEFAYSYTPTWGRHKDRTMPAPGNHDYQTTGAVGYFNYFGAAAGDPTKGYYSYDLGAWHIVVINSNCSRVGGCGSGSAQEQWLRLDLAAHPAPCTLAYWHHPLFSSGQHGNNPSVQALYQALYDYGADAVLNSHDHLYERFAPQDPSGNLDTARGIREFLVGTGGAGHYNWGIMQPNSEVRNNTTFGVMKLTLHPTSYDWEFVPEAGETFTDSGSDSCH